MEQKKYFRESSTEDLGKHHSQKQAQPKSNTSHFSKQSDLISTKPDKSYNLSKYISTNKPKNLRIETCISFTRAKSLHRLSLQITPSFIFTNENIIQEYSNSSSIMPSHKVSFGTLDIHSYRAFKKPKFAKESLYPLKPKGNFSFNRKCLTQNLSKQIKRFNKTLLVDSIPIENKYKEEGHTYREKQAVSRFINCLFGVKKKINLDSVRSKNNMATSIRTSFNFSNRALKSRAFGEDRVFVAVAQGLV
jgi:hypothetical protein